MFLKTKILNLAKRIGSAFAFLPLIKTRPRKKLIVEMDARLLSK